MKVIEVKSKYKIQIFEYSEKTREVDFISEYITKDKITYEDAKKMAKRELKDKNKAENKTVFFIQRV